MNWKELGKAVVKMGAPLLGGALGGPGGAAIGGLIARAAGAADPEDPASVMKAIQADPQAALKLKELELKHEEYLEELNVRRAQAEAEKEVGALREVNATMREEARSEYWPQYSWRPFNGFAFPVAVIATYFVLPLLGKTVPDVPEWVWIGWLSILGVATYHRGKEKRAKAGDRAQGVLAGVVSAIRGGR